MDIDLIKISKSFNQQKVLKNINYSFKPNRTYFIVGESGCGKSTLLKILAGIIDDYKGKVLLNGKNIKDIDPEYLKKHVITYIDQESTLIKYLTINENADFIINKILENKYNKKFDYYSGGEKRRISTYLNTLKDTEIILADEVSSSLDKENAVKIMDYLRIIAKNKVLIVVTHDKFLIKDEDMVLNLENNVKRTSISDKKFKYKKYNDKESLSKLLKYSFLKLKSKFKYIFSFINSFMVGLVLILLIASLKTGIISFLNEELLKNFNFDYLLVESNQFYGYGYLEKFSTLSDKGILLMDDISFDPIRNMIYTISDGNTIYFELDDDYSMSKSLYINNNYDYNLNINGFSVYINRINDERDMIIRCPIGFFDDYYTYKGYKINDFITKRCVLKINKDVLLDNYDEITNIYKDYKFKNSGIDSYVYINDMLSKIELLMIVFIIASLLVTFFLVITIIKLDINEDKQEIRFMKNSGFSDKYIFKFYYITNLYRGLLTFIVTCISYYSVISLSNYLLMQQLGINYSLLLIDFKSCLLIMVLIVTIITISMLLCKKRLKVDKN